LKITIVPIVPHLLLSAPTPAVTVLTKAAFSSSFYSTRRFGEKIPSGTLQEARRGFASYHLEEDENGVRCTRLRSAILAVLLAVVPATYCFATTLVMVDWNACPHCWQFHHEVAPEYSASPEGHMAPLRLVSVLKKWPADLEGIDEPRATPVFIRVEGGHEIGRFSSCSGPAQFWGELDQLLARMQWRQITGIFFAPPS
jgi:hypothetical protein